MNDIEKASIVYLSKRGVRKEDIARTFNATKREVEETVRKSRKGAWNGAGGICKQ